MSSNDFKIYEFHNFEGFHFVFENLKIIKSNIFIYLI